jgi:hypothetical protein
MKRLGILGATLIAAAGLFVAAPGQALAAPRCG